MLRQEINLYKKIKPAKKEVVGITWKHYWISNLILIALLSFTHLFFVFEARRLVAKSDALTVEIQTMEQAYNILKNNYPPLLFSGNITNVLKELTEASADQKRLLETITKRTLFSENFRSLSLSVVPDVWLTAFTMSEGGKTVNLKGQSLSNDALELFFVNLLHQPQFKGYSLNIKSIQKQNTDNANKRLSFDITLSARPT